WATTHSPTSAASSSARPTRRSFALVWQSCAAERTSGQWSQARTATSRSSRRPTRSRFVPTGSGQKTSLSSPTSSMPTARCSSRRLSIPSSISSGSPVSCSSPARSSRSGPTRASNDAWPGASPRKERSRAPEMEIVAVLLAVLLAVAAVAFVARPFLAEPEAEDDRLGGLTPAEQERLQLLERRDRALGALKELEVHQPTGQLAHA